MRALSFVGCCVSALLAAMLFIPDMTTAQATCDRKGIIIQDADVFREVPRYVTGSGWQGERIAVLRSTTQVYVCGERDAAFGFSTKRWMQIAYEGANKSWHYGWIMFEKLDLLKGTNMKTAPGTDAGWIPVAFAGEMTSAGTATVDWKLGKPPAAPPPQTEDKSSPSATEPGAASLSDLGELYWPLFIAMMLGMLAKAGVDWLDSSDTVLVKQHIRNAFVSILVSPIVFLGFLTAGQFSTSTQTFVVLCLLAFQNGFFWQTVLKRSVPGQQQTSAKGGGKEA